MNEEDEKIDLNQMNDMSMEDWITVESIRSSFLSNFEKDNKNYPSMDLSDRTSALISWSYVANQHALSVIKFCRGIHEFESLHADDRFSLIKYNLFPLYPILKCFFYNPKNYSCSGDTEEAVRHRKFVSLCFGEKVIREMFFNLTQSLVAITEQDSAILALLLTILMFSQGLSMNEDVPPLKDFLAANQAQSYYTKVLWNYMIDKWGEEETCKRFIQLLTVIFRMQSTAKLFRQYFRDQFTTSDTVDKIAPLIQTVLQIS
jgi:hypothetical protein